MILALLKDYTKHFLHIVRPKCLLKIFTGSENTLVNT